MTPLRPQWWRHYAGLYGYLWRGRELATGVDCWSLAVIVERVEFDEHLNEFAGVFSADIRIGLEEARDRVEVELPAWREVPWEEGAIALFRVAGHPVHVGVATSKKGVVLHAHQKTGVDLLDIPKSIKWKDRFVGCYLPR